MKQQRRTLIIALILGVLAITVLGWLYYRPDRNQDPIREYLFHVDAKVIYDPQRANKRLVKTGDAYVLEIGEGKTGGKWNTVHGHWNSIYLVLPEPPVIGVEQQIVEVYRGGYHRGYRWSVDPYRPIQVSVEPLALGSKKAKFRITGSVPLRDWISLKPSYSLKQNERVGRRNGKDVIWRKATEIFVFRDQPYTLRLAEDSEDW